MHDFVVREGQNVVFAERVGDGKRQFVVHALAEERVGLDVRQRVVHPAHIPLVVEAQSAEGRRHRHHRERRAFFRDHDHAGVSGQHRFIQGLQKVHRFQVDFAAELVALPLALSAVVIEV